MTAFRIATVLSLLMPGTGRAFSDPHLPHVGSAAAVNTRALQIERDPDEFTECFVLGELDIAFRSDNRGPPNVGVVVTDPRGRRIGFDPLTKRVWQELPVAQGTIDCDKSDDIDACGGLIEICGPLSGTYKVEVIGEASSDYSVSISAKSEELRDGQLLWSSRSNADMSNIPIRKGARHLISVNYSRDPAVKVAAGYRKLTTGGMEPASIRHHVRVVNKGSGNAR